MAPSFIHGKGTVFSVTTATGGTIVLSSGGSDSELSRTVELADVTNYGSADMEYIPGLKDGVFTFSGHFSSTHAPKLSAALGHSTGTNVDYSPLSTAAGFPHIQFLGFLQELTIGSPVADKVSVSGKIQKSGVLTSTTHA